MGFKEVLIARHSGEKEYLESMPGTSELDQDKYYIIPRKMNRDAGSRMRQLIHAKVKRCKLDPDPDRTIEQTEALVKAKAGVGEIEINEHDEEEMLRIAFLHGVHDHNFDEGGKKVEFNEALFKDLKQYPLVLQEIYNVTAGWNRKLDALLTKDDGKKNENSATPSSGGSTE